MGAFIKRYKPKETVKLEHFGSRFDEEQIVMGKHDKAKGYGIRLVNWGKLCNNCLLTFI